MRSRPRRFRWVPSPIIAKPNATDLDYIRGLVETGKLTPTVGAVLPLARVSEAHVLSESGTVNGKIVLTF